MRNCRCCESQRGGMLCNGSWPMDLCVRTYAEDYNMRHLQTCMAPVQVNSSSLRRSQLRQINASGFVDLPSLTQDVISDSLKWQENEPSLTGRTRDKGRSCRSENKSVNLLCRVRRKASCSIASGVESVDLCTNGCAVQRN